MRTIRTETGKVYAELVAAVFTAHVPLLIMSLTYLSVGSYIHVLTGSPVVGAALIVGVLASCGKGYLLLRFRQSVDSARLSADEARRWDLGFCIGHLTFATSLGVLSSATFTSSNIAAQLLATGMLFGFCAGQVARVAVRKRVCAISIFLAAVPNVIAAALAGDTVHLILAAMFGVFLIGSFESVRFAYNQIYDRIAAHHKLESVANLDPLTGLLNRLGLRQAVAEIWSKASDVHLVAVHCLDLDGFKALNDRHGHAAGDMMLRRVAERLEDCLSADDVAVRLGGDEFAIIQTGLFHPDEADMFARRIGRTMVATCEDKGTLHVGISIGSCIGHVQRDIFSDILATADQRMYDNKQVTGKRRSLGRPHLP